MHQTLAYALVALAALAVVFWIGLAYWVNKDARRRSRNLFFVGLATLLGLVPYIGPLFYLLLRPAETRAEVRSRNAEVAALESQVAHRRPTCPECRAPVEPDYLACPVCATRLREPCIRCDAPLERLWQICPYCATPVVDEVDLEEALDGALTRQVQAAPSLGLVADAARSSADV